MTEQSVTDETEILTVYWMPGCSSCLRMKEFVERRAVPHVAVNVVEVPESTELLAALGLTVPAAVLGGRGAPGVDLAAVAALAGIDYTPPAMLSPERLRARYQRIMEVAVRLVEPLSDEQLDYCEPDRPRPLRELALHIATIMRGFVVIEETNHFLQGYEFMPSDLVATGTAEEIAAVATQTLTEFEEWWERIGATDTFDRVVTSNAGHWTLHEAFERAVWHTGQHVRQLQYFIDERLHLSPPDRLGEADLAGLPIPENIHAAA